MSRGPSKGSAYEREVAKILSLWWSEGKEDDIFWRTQGSGSRATTRAKKGKKTSGQHGDICAVDERGREFTNEYTVSIKRGYNNCTIDALVDNPGRKTGIMKFVLEAKADAEKAGTPEWLLILKRDYRNALIICDYTSPSVRDSLFSNPKLNFVLMLIWCDDLFFELGVCRLSDICEAGEKS